MAAMLHTGDGHMAQKGRGIFMVYVDIDAQHAPEFNEWYNKAVVSRERHFCFALIRWSRSTVGVA